MGIPVELGQALTTPTPWPQSAGSQQVGQKNTLGLIALAVSITGFVLACIPASLTVGWILLPIAFLLGIVAASQSGKTTKAGIAAIVISVLGAVVSASIVFFAVSHLLVDLFVNLVDHIFNNSGRGGA